MSAPDSAEENLGEPEDPPSEEVAELMESHDLDEDAAERVREIMDEYDLDEDEAMEIEGEI